MTAILVSRPSGAADLLVSSLHAMGYRVHAVPTVETRPIPLEPVRLAGFDWIVLTSVQGVNALTDLPKGTRYAAVGAKTAWALEERGAEPDFVPPQANGATLARTLPDVKGKRIAVVRASAGDSELLELLRRRGAIVEEITAYQTLEGPAASAEAMRTAMADPGLAAVVFASGSAVRGYLQLGGSTLLPAVTIGPRTSASARQHGFRVIGEAEAQSAEALAAAVGRTVPLEAESNA
jgi:uroporphyrinogen-III synthase